MTAPAFQITVEPSGRQFSATGSETILAAAITAGIGLPYGCKDGACGTCKCKKLRGDVTHDSYSDNAMSAQELADGYVLTCRATAHSPVTLESKHVTDAHTPAIKKMPVRVAALDKLSHDVMRVQLQLPAHTTFKYWAGQYLEFILRDGSRRAYSMATAPHLQDSAPGVELHIRHMPGGLFTDHVFGGLKEKEILRIEGPFGSFFLREDSDKPLIFLASGTGFAP
ncbi:MAG: 2Fe-2S iron-sulfur cluster binding domain-containing protein, partial [Comamonas sp.]|nr:2Fe-2S iron-sulfur cluster binding domain-containing protein [Candidatus Comamonas equi]